jgi:hypothetical protein
MIRADDERGAVPRLVDVIAKDTILMVLAAEHYKNTGHIAPWAQAKEQR